MPTKQCPPQEELEFKIRGERVPPPVKKALPTDITSKWFRDNAYDENTESIRVTMDSPFGPDVVYVDGDITIPGISKGLMIGGVQKGTNEYKPLAIDDEGRLCVDAAISIGEVQLDVQIRALDDDSVGIWGHVDQDTGQIEPINITTEGYLKVIHQGNKNMITEYDDGTFSGSTEHTLVSYTVGAGEDFSLYKASAEGRTNGIFKLKVDGNILETRRNAWTDRNVTFEFSQGYPVVPGEVVEITVEHNQTSSCPFSGALYGESV